MVPCVEGCQVMLKVVPVEMEVGMLAMVNIFWAAAIVAKALTKNAMENRILAASVML